MTEGVDVVHLQADTTEEGGVRLTVTYGPLLASMIFDPEDEDVIVKMLQETFADARAIKEGHRVHPD